MTTLQKLLIENANNEENKNLILALAKEEGEYLMENNDAVEDVEINSSGEVIFEFTQKALDTEGMADLYSQASDSFNENFNLRAKSELPTLF